MHHEIVQEYLTNLYQEMNGYLKYTPQEIENYSHHDVCLTYGEVHYLSLMAFAKKIHLGPHDIFLDLGSGLGKICVSVLLGTECQEAIGIEASLKLHQQAIKIFPKLELKLKNKQLSLLQGNFLSPDKLPNIKKATVVFINATAFTYDLLDKIGLVLNQCPNIRAILSFKPFANLTLPFSQTIRIEASWDSILARLYSQSYANANRNS